MRVALPTPLEMGMLQWRQATDTARVGGGGDGALDSAGLRPVLQHTFTTRLLQRLCFLLEMLEIPSTSIVPQVRSHALRVHCGADLGRS